MDRIQNKKFSGFKTLVYVYSYMELPRSKYLSLN